MKKFLLITAGLAFLAGVTSGQEYKSRQPTPTEQSRIAGITSYVQDELLRSKTPKFIDMVTSSNYLATAYNDGLLFVRSYNTAAVCVITLPNPTNNINRRFELVPVKTASLLLTNGSFGANGFQIADINTVTWTNSLAVASNKTAFVFSTGTNWIGYIR